MKTFKVVAVSLFIASVALAGKKGGAQPEVVSAEVTGEAAIVGGNKDRAVKEAKDQALRAAVEQVAGVMIEADTLTENNELVSDRIFANATGYVRSFEVVKQEEKGGVMAVTVKAQVGRAQLDKDLQAVKALVKRLGSRKLLIVTQEQAFAKDAVFKSGALSTELTNVFKKDGWQIIDPKFAGDGALELASSVTVGGTPPAEKIASVKGADFVLYGSVSIRYIEPDKALGFQNGQQILFPISGEYDLSVFSTKTGLQLGKVAGKLEMAAVNVMKAGVMSYERTTYNVVQARGEEISKQIRAAIYEGIRDQQVNGQQMSLVVNGISDYSSVQNFSKVLRESISGVNGVGGETKFGEGKAEYELTFVGTSGDLAERLEGKTFKGRKVSVSKVDKAGVEVTLAK